MCTGLEVAALLATAAGTAKQVSATRKTRRANEAAANFELQKKAETNKQAEAIFEDQLALSDPGDAAAAADKAAEQQLMETQALLQRPDTGFTGTGDTPAMAQASPVVKESAAKSLAQELQRAEGQMKARASLTGLGQRFRDRAVQFGRGAELMQQLGNFNQGWTQVGNIQQSLAKNAGAKDAMLGDVLVGLGSMGMQYGAATRGLGATAGAPSAAGTGMSLAPTETVALLPSQGYSTGLNPAARGASGLKAPTLWR